MITKEDHPQDWQTFRVLIDSPIEGGELVPDDVLEATLKVASTVRSEAETIQAIRALAVSLAFQRYADDIETVNTELIIKLCEEVFDVAAGHREIVEEGVYEIPKCNRNKRQRHRVE